MKAILTKMLAIMEEVDRIEKDGENKFHKYKYASEKIIKETLHAALVKHKVVFYISGAEQSVIDIRLESGKPERLTSVVLTYCFCDPETGECLQGQGVGQGQDPGDKGSYKAITGALKYILTTSFLIPTGDDPEADNGTDKAASAPPKTKKEPVEIPKVDQFRAMYLKLPVSKQNIDFLKTLLPIADFTQIKDCTDTQLAEGIDKINITLSEGK